MSTTISQFLNLFIRFSTNVIEIIMLHSITTLFLLSNGQVETLLHKKFFFGFSFFLQNHEILFKSISWYMGEKGSQGFRGISKTIPNIEPRRTFIIIFIEDGLERRYLLHSRFFA